MNRTQYTSFFDDENYQLALKYADFSQIELYKNEAAVKLMVKLKVPKKELLATQEYVFSWKQDYAKIIRFGSSELKAEIKGYNDTIYNRTDDEYKQRVYQTAIDLCRY